MSFPVPEQDILNSIVRRYFRVDDITQGDPAKDFLVRYRGQLLMDSIEAFDGLSEALRHYRLTPLFRKDENDGHIVMLVPSLPDPKPSNAWINVALFLATVLSVIYIGTYMVEPEMLAGATSDQEILWLSLLHGGFPYAASLLSILLAHEFGHYLMTRYHKTVATLPYFIPVPIGLGTLGAVIVWKQPPRNKRTLFDVGVAGPLAGLVVAIPVVLYGLYVSKTGLVTQAPNSVMEGNSILYLLSKYIIFGKLLPAPASYGNLSPVLYWIRYFFTGYPLPIGGTDVHISPIAMAGWVGLLVTALNLIPAGQLDGGHVMYVLFGQKLKLIFPVIIVIMGLLSYFYFGWWLWIFLLLIFGRQSADPLDQITELDPGRRALAYFMIFVFIMVFMPIPMISLG